MENLGDDEYDAGLKSADVRWIGAVENSLLRYMLNRSVTSARDAASMLGMSNEVVTAAFVSMERAGVALEWKERNGIGEPKPTGTFQLTPFGRRLGDGMLAG